MFRIILSIISVICLLLLVIYAFDKNQSNSVIHASIPVADAISYGDTSGFKRVIIPRAFSFPEDHGPHPGFQSEWWYFTGNLKSEEKKHFGYQITFFRQTVSNDTVKRKSEWASNEIYMGHLAVTDVSDNKFYAFERFSRSINKLAGAQTNPFKVWLDDWEVNDISKQNSQTIFKIVANDEDIKLELTLVNQKPEILQGEKGLSKKGSEPGNASYYYSLTRLKSEGTITINKKEFQLSGWSWMDREWSTNVLAKDQIGWDWFSLQLDTNQEVMYYQIRKRDGSIDPFSAGTVIYESGKSKTFSNDEIKLTVEDTWLNPNSVVYPSGWILNIPGEDLKFEIEPYIKNQELNVSTQYWEGAVKIKGENKGEAVKGSGYVELTGYKEQALFNKQNKIK